MEVPSMECIVIDLWKDDIQISSTSHEVNTSTQKSQTFFPCYILYLKLIIDFFWAMLKLT